MGINIYDLDKDNPLRKKVIDQIGHDNKRNASNEHWLQTAAVGIFYEVYGHKYPGKLFAIPNGGLRDTGTALKLKREGMMAGVWDLFLSVPAHGYGGCWIETKIQGNGLTESQKWFRENHEGDYDFFVYRSCAELITGIENYLNGKSNKDLSK